MKQLYQILWIAVLLLVPYLTAAQRECGNSNNKAANALYNNALSAMDYSKKEAIRLLEEALKKDPNHVRALYVLADLNYQSAINTTDTSYTKQISYFARAEEYFLKVTATCPEFNNYSAFFYLGEYNYHIRSYSKAKEYLSNFVNNNPANQFNVSQAKEMIADINYYFELKNNPVPFNPTCLPNICTENDEFLPFISPDGEHIYYTRRYKKGDLQIEELTYSKLKNDTTLPPQFDKGIALGPPFNDGRNQGGATITVDNKHMFITICDYRRTNYTSYKNCDIYTTDFIKGEWTPLRRMSDNINGWSTFEGQPSISSDGRELYFASAREGGVGGLDIYKSVRNNDGIWQKAENLGPQINTSGDDKTPFLHSDTRTLYYATNGLFGLGGFDIFYTQQKSETEWTKPKNMGYPINTVKDEVGLIVSADGEKIYLSSNNLSGPGGWDIYVSDLYKDARPHKILFVKGKLIDQNGNTIKGGIVELQNTQTKKKTSVEVDNESGKYAIVVEIQGNEDFIMTAKKDGYFFKSTFIESSDPKYTPPTNIDISIEKIETNKTIRLDHVQFNTNSANLTETSILVLDYLVDFLKQNPELKIFLKGHTDNVGEDNFNQELSSRRARSVRRYLINNQISYKRIRYKGYGEKQPIAENNSESNKALNRRVEFVVEK